MNFKQYVTQCIMHNMIIVMNLVTIKAMEVATMDCYLLIHEANSFKKN
jgi:hypothetical protein